MIRKNKNPINLDQRKKDFFWNQSTVIKKKYLWFSEKQQLLIVQGNSLKMR